jgi:hypothetical protein
MLKQTLIQMKLGWSGLIKLILAAHSIGRNVEAAALVYRDGNRIKWWGDPFAVDYIKKQGVPRTNYYVQFWCLNGPKLLYHLWHNVSRRSRTDTNSSPDRVFRAGLWKVVIYEGERMVRKLISRT